MKATLTTLLLLLLPSLGFSAAENRYQLKILKVMPLAADGLPSAGKAANVELEIFDSHAKRTLRSKDLKVVHEERFHLFAFDEGLTSYLHLHPTEPKAGRFRVVMPFAKPGQYKIYADITLKSGSKQLYLRANQAVGGAGQAGTRPSALEPLLSGTDRGSTVELKSAQNMKAAKMVMPTLHFSRTDGSEPNIKPYLGALAHILITDLSGEKLVHAHPMQMGGRLMLHTEFPEPGDYRLFVQFLDQRKGESKANSVRTVELAVRVQ